jgi:membrane-bound serine protease (ClpP class)
MGPIITLLVLGAVLLYLETFLPGWIAGLLGVVCIFSAVVLGYVDLGFRGGNIVAAITVLAGCIGAWAYFKYFPDSSAARRFTSDREIGTIGAEQPELLHKTGSALTALRPSGTALIEGRRVDVVADGMMIERGGLVKVVAIEGLRVVVRPLV